jgi:NCS1 family nucleobase:cation symporter-1
LGAIGVILHSRSASTYHFGFPVESRIPWGLRAAYFPVLIRVVTCTIWVGVSLIQGGYFVAVCLRCIFGHHFSDIPNHIPASAGINIQQMIGLIVIWFGSLPLLSVPIPRIRHIFSVKSVILPPITVGLFIYCMLQGKGKVTGFAGTVPMKGTTLAWAMVSISLGQLSPKYKKQMS